MPMPPPGGPPQGALSQVQPPAPAPPPPPQPGPPGTPPMGQNPPAGALPPGPGQQPPPGPEGPPAGAGGQPKPPRPGNEGLINRVLGLVSGETKQKEREEHQKALVEAMRAGATQAMQGLATMGTMMAGGMGGGEPTDRIRGLLGQSGAPPDMAGQGLARGGYPDLIGMEEPPGLPVRQPFSTGGTSNFVPPNGMSGRSDKVEARLSPNEYVMDAETVAALGDGSPDAGADKLDRMRTNIRKHKGKALAKGKFSPNAKKPESYL